jgi:pimeloyl-ACP methyl ester carboxylesterase
MAPRSAAAQGGATYLLVHGAWHGGWCWRRVADRLTTAGHRVLTPTQTGLGERAHLMSRDISMDVFVADLVQVMEAEELRDVIVVGHSYGSRSAAGLVDRMPERVRRLVLLDSSIPQPGAYFDLLPPAGRAERIAAAAASSGGISIPPAPASYFGVTAPEDVAWLDRRLTPQPLSSYATPLTLRHPPGNGRPVTYIRCTVPGFAIAAAAAAHARTTPGWQYLEIPTGHDAMITAPAELSDMLMTLA